MADRSRYNRASTARASRRAPPSRIHQYAEQVVLRYSIIEPERIEQASLIPIQPPHHRRLQAGDPWNQRNHCSATFSTLFRQHRTQSGNLANTASHYRVIDASLVRINWNYTLAPGPLGGTNKRDDGDDNESHNESLQTPSSSRDLQRVDAALHGCCSDGSRHPSVNYHAR